MKTFEEKAEDLCRRLDIGDVGCQNYNEVVKLLKEQDRDTRHACEEAVSKLGFYDGLDNIVVARDAHCACMNTKGG